MKDSAAWGEHKEWRKQVVITRAEYPGRSVPYDMPIQHWIDKAAGDWITMLEHVDYLGRTGYERNKIRIAARELGYKATTREHPRGFRVRFTSY